MTALPICCVTGRIAGDPHACGDCDPCGAAHLPEVVKDLIKERDEWADKYASAMVELGELRLALAPFANLAGKLDGAPNLIGLLTEDDFRRAREAIET